MIGNRAQLLFKKVWNIIDQIDTLCWLVHYVFASRINRGEQLSLTELRFFVRLGQDKNCFKWLSSTLKEGVWQQQQREWEMNQFRRIQELTVSFWIFFSLKNIKIVEELLLWTYFDNFNLLYLSIKKRPKFWTSIPNPHQLELFQ